MNMKTSLTLLITLILFSCGGAEDKKASYYEKANQWFEQENYEKARIELKNVLQIDPKDVEARLLLAKVFEKTQDFRGAAKQYNAVLQQDENNVEARIRLGQFLLLSQQFDKAMEYAELALENGPEDSNAYAFRGSVHLKQGNSEAAMRDAIRALELQADNANATLLKSSVLNKMGNTEEAIATLEKATSEQPDNMMLPNALVNLYALNKQTDKAIETLNTIIEKSPDVMLPRLRLADMQYAQGSFEATEATMRKAIQDFPDNDQVKLALVKFLRKEFGTERAMQEMKSFIADNPDKNSLKFILASEYLKAGDAEPAIEIYQGIIDKEELKPDALTARVYLSEVNIKLGKSDAAKALLEEVLNESPGNSSALSLRGQLSMLENDYDGAIADFRAAMRDQPNSVPLMTSLAKAHIAKEELDLASDLLKRAIDIKPDDLRIREPYLRLLARKGDADNLVKQLDDILEKFPDNLPAMEMLFRVQAAQQDWDALNITAEKMKRVHPNKANGYYFAGLLLTTQKKYKESIPEYEKAVELAPKGAEPLKQLIKTYLTLDQKDAALAKLDEIIAADEANVLAYNLKGETLLSFKEIDAAKEVFTKAIEVNPKLPVLYRNLAKAHILDENVDEAVKTYEAGIQTTESSPLLVADLARYYESSGNTDKAISLYEELILIDENSQIGKNNLAMLLVDYRGDKESLDRAHSLMADMMDTNNAAYQDTIGWLFYKEGKIKEAISYLEKAVAASPENPGLNFHLGMAYARNGDTEKAKEALTIATSTEARYLGYEDAVETLQQL